jgi:hypothetical protein
LKLSQEILIELQELLEGLDCGIRKIAGREEQTWETSRFLETNN